MDRLRAFLRASYKALAPLVLAVGFAVVQAIREGRLSLSDRRGLALLVLSAACVYLAPRNVQADPPAPYEGDHRP